MGFLDNSGDIILDAVLTDVGRKRMAEGNFSITKFALGDDEIDYSLYNKTHPSGTTYFDLEIMQTPVMEAFTQANAGINYGLLTITAADLLYLPVLEINKKSPISNTVKTHSNFANVYFVADTTADTTTNLLASTALGDAKYFAVSNQSSGPAILLEGGLNTTVIKGDSANRTTYLVNNNLVDNYYYVYYDSRFLDGILGADTTAVFNNTDNGDGTSTLNYTLARGTSVSTDLQLENYSAARVAAPNNGVYYVSGQGVDDKTISQIQGPRSSFTLINAVVKTTLDVEYTRYGTTNNTLFSALGDSALYNYIDTTLYVQGNITGIQAQIPLRIVKYVSG